MEAGPAEEEGRAGAGDDAGMMSADVPSRLRDWDIAVAHLRRDRVLRKIIDRVGPCKLAPRRDYFVALCKSIYAQQVSAVVARVLFDRFLMHFPRRRPTPRLVHALLTGHEDSFRACGLSRQKRKYLIDLSLHFMDGRIATRKLAALDDEQVIEALVNVQGIGRWTAEMFLIFVLNRPDVLPVDDLGIREAFKRFYRLPERPGAKQMQTMAVPWRPWRSVATWYLWRSLSIPPATRK
jgi:DNA-3-methyladenine glycosylase II